MAVQRESETIIQANVQVPGNERSFREHIQKYFMQVFDAQSGNGTYSFLKYETESGRLYLAQNSNVVLASLTQNQVYSGVFTIANENLQNLKNADGKVFIFNDLLCLGSAFFETDYDSQTVYKNILQRYQLLRRTK